MHSNKYDVVNMNNNEYHMNNNARESQELHCIELLMLYIYIYMYISHILPSIIESLKFSDRLEIISMFLWHTWNY